MRIKMIETSGKYKKGQVYNLIVYIAKRLVNGGFAKKEYK